VARETGDREILAYAVWASSEPLGLTGRLEEQAKLLDHALAEVRAVAAPYEVACLGEICVNAAARGDHVRAREVAEEGIAAARASGRRMEDRKSTRLNSSHVATSYAVFCLKKKTRTWSAARRGAV